MFENSGKKVKDVAKLFFNISVASVAIILSVVLIGLSTQSYYLGGGTAFLMLYCILVAAIIVFAIWAHTIFLVAFGDLVSSNERIVELLENKQGISKTSNNDIVKYMVVFGDGSECEIQISKNSNWEEIENFCKNQNKQEKEIKYIVDENGRQVFKGGYLG